MAAIYSNGGNRWNILGFNFTKRDALSSVYKISMVNTRPDFHTIILILQTVSPAVVMTSPSYIRKLPTVEVNGLYAWFALVVRIRDFRCLWSLVCRMLCLSEKNTIDRR
jgi:hypothetical protein